VQKKRNKSNVNLIERHGGVLGIAALIESRPYDIPEWMPSLLMTLSMYNCDPSPIKETVRNTFAEFWRTHQDGWRTHQTKFTEEQLTILNENVLSPSYYASDITDFDEGMSSKGTSNSTVSDPMVIPP